MRVCSPYAQRIYRRIRYSLFAIRYSPARRRNRNYARDARFVLLGRGTLARRSSHNS